MKITRVSGFSGITRTLDLDITEDQLKNFENGMSIQKAMPNLTPGEREFILTGIDDKEWDEIFHEDDPD